MRRYTMVFIYACDTEGNYKEEDALGYLTLSDYYSVEELANSNILDDYIEVEDLDGVVKFELFYMLLKGYEDLAEDTCKELMRNRLADLISEERLVQEGYAEFFAQIKDAIYEEDEIILD